LPVNINVFKEKIIMKAVSSRKELERSFNHFLLKKNNDHPSSEHQIYV
jgi:Fe-S cluster biosynthesis and repair protein YggX